VGLLFHGKLAKVHPRSRHTGRYDFALLTKNSPELGSFASRNPSGEPTIDFSDPRAVLALNRALLVTYYGLSSWELPPGYLCPPIPGRADLVHAAAELIGGRRGDPVRVLDVGVGANCVYPIIGRAEYGWRFVGCDTDRIALAAAQRIVDANPSLAGGVELRLQSAPHRVLAGVINAGEFFDLVLCNPPFHASLEAAREASAVKWTKLGRSPGAAPNFAGVESELWCPGGEEAFARRMIEDSAVFKSQILWCTILISKASCLPSLDKALTKFGAVRRRVIDMAQGQKKSRLVAWSFKA